MTLRPDALRISLSCAVALLLSAPMLHAAPPKAAAGQSGQSSAGAAGAAGAAAAGPDRSNAYYHYGLAQMYEEMAVNAGRPDYANQAVEEYKMALNADPSSRMLQDGLAELYFRIGRVQDAVNTAKDQVKRDPEDVDAHTLLGQVYLRSLGDMQGTQAQQTLQSAIAEFETLARLKPEDIENKLLLGQLYALNHDSAKAEAEFKAAQKIDANSEDVVLNMARLYAENGDVQRAVETIQAVPETDRTARMEFALGANLEEQKKYKDAAAAYRRSLDIEPDNPDVELALGNALLQDEQLDEALKAYTTLATADPTNAQAQIHIAEIQRRQGHYAEALATLEAAKKQAPDSAELNVNEALVYDALGQYDQATAILVKLVEGSTNAGGKYSEQDKRTRAYLLDRLGQIYREQDKTAEAIATYKQMIELGGDCSSAPAKADDAGQVCYMESGYDGEVETYREAHQWKDAESAAAEGAKAMPKDHDAQLLYALQMADNGQAEQGMTLARAQLTGGSGGPGDVEVYEDLGQMDIRLKRYSDAMQQLDKAEALTKKPMEKVSVLYVRGELYERQKQFDQAEAEFRKALAIDPQNAGVLNYLGYMLADNGQKLPEALKMIQQAVEQEPQSGAYLDSLGWVYYKMGQYTLAEENLRKANERMNSDPTVHDHLGEVYEKTGNLKMAVAQWERSMTEYAHSLPADAEPADVAKVQHKLENARVKLAKVTSAPAETSK